MAIVVQHMESKEHYVVVGTGYGMYESRMPSFWGVAVPPEENKGFKAVVCVSDRDGKIGYFGIGLLQVVSVDGQSPRDLIENTETTS